jgi:hypothetical protein
VTGSIGVEDNLGIADARPKHRATDFLPNPRVSKVYSVEGFLWPCAR